ncbi:DUF5074 domain-containing protein [Parabacteroides sp. PF5-9]|uniref:DUF5074 domain-containing protein n=1 Tax=Parabacteroides sp. PF5-9 TaxID=1742404 RepID=UPI0024767112|nr:DUF5074 domain-containing protein [Parabacteroides sp. PF5-9]
MKKLVYAFLVCAFALPFTSCKDDDKDEVFAPAEKVENLTFNDTDMDPLKIGGTLSWTNPTNEDNISGYNIYLSENVTDRSAKLGAVSKGKNSFDIPAGTAMNTYLLVVAYNATGESANAASITVKDNSGDPIVTEMFFADEDKAKGFISGTLTWTNPSPEGYITGYVIYSSDNSTEKGTKLGEVEAGKSTFEIPEGTVYQPYLFVITKKGEVESENIASLAIEDYIVENPVPLPYGMYLLNGGNWNENNASISFYDFNTGEMTGHIYQTANGSGLGDSAEQILMYGSKIYATVTTSNRIVVLDREGKLIKSIEPKEGEEPVNPRGIVADNGKVYISYFYGHAVAVLDTATLQIEKQVKVGRYPEKLTVANGKIYVANSGGNDYPNYGKTVSVIDAGTLEVEKEIEVLINPVSILSDSQGDIYVISMGDYGDVKNTLQRIDAKTNDVTIIDNASKMTLVNDELYTIYAQWGEPEIKYRKYNVLTEEVLSESFIEDTSVLSSPNAIAVDEQSGKIFITNSDWGSTSSLYIFAADGKLEKGDIDTKGYEAKSMIFAY